MQCTVVAVLTTRKNDAQQQEMFAPMKRMCGLLESSVGELLTLAITNVSTMARHTLNIAICELFDYERTSKCPAGSGDRIPGAGDIDAM